jgi:acylphosphatase
MTWKIRKVSFKGRVQGVGFRAAVQREARALGVRGWVENQADGSVEAVFIEKTSVEEERILQLLRKITAGLGSAQLTHLEVTEAEWSSSESPTGARLEAGQLEFGPGQPDGQSFLEGCEEDFLIRS